MPLGPLKKYGRIICKNGLVGVEIGVEKGFVCFGNNFDDCVTFYAFISLFYDAI